MNNLLEELKKYEEDVEKKARVGAEAFGVCPLEQECEGAEEPDNYIKYCSKNNREICPWNTVHSINAILGDD